MIGDISHSEAMTTSKAATKPVDHEALVFPYPPGAEAVSLAARTCCVGLKGWFKARFAAFIPPWGYEDDTGFHFGTPSGRADLSEPQRGECGGTEA
jgi:hypothetical protein